MGLRCLLGHDFGEPEPEREREEEGNEVVVTVREVKTCQTCGETRVVSENKEIKSIEQLRRSAAGDAGARDAPVDDGSADPSSPDPSPVVDPADTVAGRAAEREDRGVADIIEDAETAADPSSESTGDADPVGGPVGEDSATIDESSDESADDADATGDDETPTHPAEQEPPESDADHDPAEEDAIILDDESDAGPETGREQWEEAADPEDIPGHVEPAPDVDDDGDGHDAVIMDASETADESPRTEEGYTPWPTKEGADEGRDAETPESDQPDVAFGGLTPDDDGAETDEASGAETDEAPGPQTDVDPAVNGAEADATPTETGREGTGSGRSGEGSPSAPSLDLERSPSEARLEYHCPDCGLTRVVGNSSMRAGDICPECHQGYIAERPRRD